MKLFRRKPSIENTASDNALHQDADAPDGPDAAVAPDVRCPEDPYAALGIPREAVSQADPPDPPAVSAPAVDAVDPPPPDAEPLPPVAVAPVAAAESVAPVDTDGAPFVARARMANYQQSMPARRRIWDLEREEPHAVPGEAPSGAEDQHTAPAMDAASAPAGAPADDVALARQQIARFSQAGLAPGQAVPDGGRAKTRVLGFQSAAFAERDPFAGAARQGDAAAPMFPVGWIVVVEGPGRGASFTLSSGVSSIGRGEDQTVRLDFGDRSISRQNHASIAFDDESSRFFLGQGGKSNIVRLNGRPVLSTEDLSEGDTIRIGETSLRFVAFCGERFDWTAEDERTADAHVAAE
ncbi:FHA domain-containing protein [Aliiruegeria haliotis]|uniref:FHA domain-containing protein n=1 Tax=Aliiruegeria haliotis TaxID=1280846 RepID=A0A2T0RZ23_9RHOB|nr:FHA domain-containing protein [Aliiruegeria haliotis]PRY26417.1 FHA domain-containing protein [Aliiruegeria haliotis]